MNRVIILEGPDGSGKSTLASKLVTEHGFSVIRSYGITGYGPTWSSSELMLELTHVIARALDPGNFRPIVIDRSFLSEFAYGMVMRGKDRLGVDGFKALTHLVRTCGVEEVICLPPWETVRGNWRVKRQLPWDPVAGTGDYVDGEHKLEEIYQNYASLESSNQYTKFDYTIDSIEKVIG